MFQYFLKVVKSTYKGLDGKNVSLFRYEYSLKLRSPCSIKPTSTALHHTSEISPRYREE